MGRKQESKPQRNKTPTWRKAMIQIEKGPLFKLAYYASIHYDSNYPMEDRKITVRVNPDESASGWHYDISDNIKWDSDNDECFMTYVPYDVYSAVWKDRGDYDQE